MIETPTLARLIKKAIDNRLLDVHTALIAKNEVSLEEWFNHKASSLPSNQRFTLEGAIAIPGVYPLRS